jgi:two-component system, LytTR family, response regulator
LTIILKKVIIIDDEQAARKLLREYISEYSELTIIGECKNGLEATDAIDLYQPDLVFLDIQMPGRTGFEVLQHIEHLPQVIFSTAFDQYALKAFEVNALDYLLKPYTRDRFRQAVTKALSDESRSYQNLVQLTENLWASGSKTTTYPERILVENGTKFINLKVEDLVWLEAYGDYTKLHTAKNTYLSSNGISHFEQKLNPQNFQRIHRSAIINLDHLREVHRDANGFQVVIATGLTLKVSRSYAEVFRKMIV